MRRRKHNLHQLSKHVCDVYDFKSFPIRSLPQVIKDRKHIYGNEAPELQPDGSYNSRRISVSAFKAMGNKGFGERKEQQLFLWHFTPPEALVGSLMEA